MSQAKPPKNGNGNGKSHGATLEEAANMTTPKGTKFFELTAEQLKELSNHPSVSPAMKDGAKLMLSKVSPEAMKKWSELANRAKKDGIEFEPLKGDATYLVFYNAYTGLAALVESG